MTPSTVVAHIVTDAGSVRMTMEVYHALRATLLARAPHRTIDDALDDLMVEYGPQLYDDEVADSFMQIAEHIATRTGICWQGRTGVG